MMDQRQLRDLLHYDPDIGIFTYRKSTGRRKVGDVAGYVDQWGYVRIRCGGKAYRAHRLAALYMTGSFPQSETDHINRVKADNRWANLRPATTEQNAGNKGIWKHNTSGVRGVGWDAVRKAWTAQIMDFKKTRHLGRFATKEAAIRAYVRAAREKWGEFYTGAKP